MSEVTSIHAARSASTAARSANTASHCADGKSFSAALADARRRPKGERTEYLNRTGHAGDGEAFRIVQRGGRTFHVYGSGEDHKVFELPNDMTSSGFDMPTDGTPAA
jgi:hypothetical protein